MTRHYAVLGSPITHSLSPIIHSFCFEKLGVDASYESFELASGLKEFLITKPDFQGFSVTMPLKDEAFAICSTRSELAEITQSVNTITVARGEYIGHNTDVLGIQAAINHQLESVAVLGSGATARSALAAFPDAKKLIFARNIKAAQELAKSFDAEVVSFEGAYRADAVISTLPKGVLPELAANAKPPTLLLDAAYTNPQLPADKFVSGVQMLIHQAIFQQRIFLTGNQNQPLNNEAVLLEGLMAELIVAK